MSDVSETGICNSTSLVSSKDTSNAAIDFEAVASGQACTDEIIDLSSETSAAVDATITPRTGVGNGT